MRGQSAASAPPGDAAHAVDRAISGRYANRFFLDRQVRREEVHAILDVARFAPSGANIQPWKVYVLAGAAKDDISADILRAHASAAGAHAAEYAYYAAELPEPFRGRRAKFGAAYYSSLGIDQADQAARLRQTAKNYGFFGAPIGLILCIDRRLEIGSWLDFGTFLQSIMIAAKARGLDTCPQETLAKYHAVLRKHLPIAPQEIVVCGMSLGFADPAAATTRGVQEKLRVEEFAGFFGFATADTRAPPKFHPER
ncbi:MAG: nitroreductase [Proteobacteria bacterium]|nr:nitroreductase [Pseudomonadota bacterium]